MERAYVCLDLTTGDRDKAVLDAVGWALQRCSRSHPEAVLWIRHKDDLDELPKTRRLVRDGLTIQVDRIARRTGPLPHTGPVVALDQPLERLALLEPSPHPVVLVGALIPDLLPARHLGLALHQPWIDAFDPEHIDGPGAPRRTPLAGQPVLTRALSTFTSDTGAGQYMSKRDDESHRVAHGLQVLHADGHRVNPDELAAAALAAGWRGSGALQLRDIARDIARGDKRRVRSRHRRHTIDSWQTPA